MTTNASSPQFVKHHSHHMGETVNLLYTPSSSSLHNSNANIVRSYSTDFRDNSYLHRNLSDSSGRRIHHDDFYYRDPSTGNTPNRRSILSYRPVHSGRWDSTEGVGRMYGEEVTPAVPAGIVAEMEYDPGLSFDSSINVGISECANR